jgi:hypothetical protein
VRTIKFRQPIVVKGEFQRFRYWGCTDTAFTSPVDNGGGLIESQQFTGLQGGDGKDLYEGDIFNIYDDYGTIVWGDADAAWLVEFQCEDGTQEYERLCDLATSSTIGNIFEHPSLLTPSPVTEEK